MMHGSTRDRLMIRMAGEGVPVLAIARILGASTALTRVTLKAAVAEGQLLELPPEAWLRRSEQPDGALTIEEVDTLADTARVTLALTGAQARMLSALALRGIVDNGTMRGLVCGPDAEPTTVKVVACLLRQKLKPHGISIETIWGRGYRLTAADRAKAIELIQAVAA